MSNKDKWVTLINQINETLSTSCFQGMRWNKREIAIQKINKMQLVCRIIESKLDLPPSFYPTNLKIDIEEKEFERNGKFRERYNDIRRSTSSFLKRNLKNIRPELRTKQAKQLALRTKGKIDDFLSIWCDK